MAQQLTVLVNVNVCNVKMWDGNAQLDLSVLVLAKPWVAETNTNQRTCSCKSNQSSDCLVLVHNVDVYVKSLCLVGIRNTTQVGGNPAAGRWFADFGRIHVRERGGHRSRGAFR
jgi:hypothetical protein